VVRAEVARLVGGDGDGLAGAVGEALEHQLRASTSRSIHASTPDKAREALEGARRELAEGEHGADGRAVDRDVGEVLLDGLHRRVGHLRGRRLAGEARRAGWRCARTCCLGDEAPARRR